jgi:hypothetical protein
MKNYTGFYIIIGIFFFTINQVRAQVNPGNDPAMWDYVDPTLFWAIMIILAVIVGGVIIFFRIQQHAQTKN